MESGSPISGHLTAAPAGFAAGSGPVPLFHAAWLFAAGIATTQALWLRPSLVLIALALLAVLCAVAALRAQRIVWLPLASLWLLLGAWCAGWSRIRPPRRRWRRSPTICCGRWKEPSPMPGQCAARSSRIVDEPGAALTRPAQRIDLRVSSLEVVTDTEDAQRPVEGGVRLTVRWPEKTSGQQPFQCGERLRAVVRLLPPEVYRDPGVWSRKDFLIEQGITSTATVRIDRVERIGHGFRLLSSLPHQRLAARLERPAAGSARGHAPLPAPLRLSQDDAIMLAAMVTGDRTYLTHSLRAGFERTGSFHMLVVSGFHLAIMAGCIFWLARRLRLPRIPATLVTILASFAYAFSRASPPRSSAPSGWSLSICWAG